MIRRTMSLQFQATHKFARIAPRKARYVADMIRHKPVTEALRILKFTNRRAAPLIDKVLRSAIANAGEEANKRRLNIDAAKLFVREATIEEGPTFKRWRPRSRGMANPILKRNSHIRITLAPIEGVEITEFGKKKQKKQAEPTPATDAAANAEQPAGSEGEQSTKE